MKEQQRKERAQEKLARRQRRNVESPSGPATDSNPGDAAAEPDNTEKRDIE